MLINDFAEKQAPQGPMSILRLNASQNSLLGQETRFLQETGFLASPYLIGMKNTTVTAQ